MATFDIVDAKAYHCGQMARMLRREHHQFLLRVGVDVHGQIRALYEESCFRKAWTVDGVLAGLGGVQGSLLSHTGLVWVTLTERATRYPVQIVKEARRQLAEIMLTKTELTTTVSFDDPAAQRFALAMGFHPSGAIAAASPVGRRHLVIEMNNNPDHRVLAGNHYQIGMRYDREMAL